MKIKLMMRVLLLPLVAGLGFSIAGCKKSPDSESPAAPSPDSSASTDTSLVTTGGPIEMKIKWPVGAHYVQRMDITQQMETTMEGMPQSMKQDVEMSQEYGLTTLGDRPDGSREVEMEFLSMQMIVRSGGRELLNFDSQGESLDSDKNPVAAMFRNLVGARIKFILDASNQVSRVEGLQEFRNKAMNNAPPAARASMGQMLSEDYFKQMINFGQGMPDKPVQPGDQWPVQREITMGPLGVMHLDMQYTFKGYETHDQRQCARLDFTGTMTSDAARRPMNPQMKMAIEDGVTEGQTWYDPKQSMVVGADVNQKMIMKVELNAPSADTNQAPVRRTMSTAMNQQIHITITPN